MEKQRVDVALIKRQLVDSRNKAKLAIQANLVKINNVIINKVNFLVNESDVIELISNDKYVSRGAYKLDAAIKHWNINLSNKVCVDIGCSTGGFSQIMLENDCKKIYAIDVGTNQFSQKILCDKVQLFEQTHFLDVTQSIFQEKIDFIGCDVSFISATKIINHINDTLVDNFKMVCLIKPQFELSKKIIDNNNAIIKDKKLHDKAIDKIISCIKNKGYKIHGVIDSPITGAKKQNKEFLVFFEKI